VTIPATEIWSIGAFLVLLLSAVGVWDGYADVRLGNGQRTLAVAYLIGHATLLALSLAWLYAGLIRLGGPDIPLDDALFVVIITPYVVAALAALDLGARRVTERLLAERSNERLDRIEKVVQDDRITTVEERPGGSE